MEMFGKIILAVVLMFLYGVALILGFFVGETLIKKYAASTFKNPFASETKA